MMTTNRTYFFTILILTILFVTSCNNIRKEEKTNLVTTIAFGSCAKQYENLSIFDTIVTHKPDLFIFLGDNIYGDTKNMDTLRNKYAQLNANKSFKNLKKSTPIVATWDDHDYGWNDAGKEYPFKKQSKEIFLEFFNEPKKSLRRTHDGIYHSYNYKYADKILQVIMLDVRTFRDGLKPYNGDFDDDERYSFYEKEFSPVMDKDSTFLGNEQWNWLENELKKFADIRLICSGNQFGIEWNSYESWANFPYEREKMLDLIKETKANGVIFLTGDVHYSEISKLETSFYPIYDFTSSGLTSKWKFATPNKNRIEGPVMDNHFGLLTINWGSRDPKIKMENWDIYNNQRFELTIDQDNISF